jgi:hypothetical protein
VNEIQNFTDESLRTLAGLIIHSNYKDYKMIIIKTVTYCCRLRITDSIKSEMLKTDFGDSNIWGITLLSDFKDSGVSNLP